MPLMVLYEYELVRGYVIIVYGNCGQINKIFYFNNWWNYKKREYDNLGTSKRQFGTYISKIQISKCNN